MRHLAIAAGLLLATSLPCWAQSGSDAGDAPWGYGQAPRVSESRHYEGEPWMSRARGEDEDRDSWRSEGSAPDRPRNGPAIRLKTEGFELGLRCGNDDSIRICAETALALMNRAGSLRAGSGSPAGGSPPAPESAPAAQPGSSKP